MNKGKALVPKLRFVEFQKSEGWAVRPFQKLFTIGSGRDYKHLSMGSVPVYGSGGHMLCVNDFLYDGESVCIGRKGTINNPMFLTGKFWTVDTLFYTHSFQQCLPKFIFAIFQNIDWLKHNEAGGVPSLSKTIIEKIQTAIPEILEQQKIADCLSSLNELIAALTRKVDALKTHKKGLMQQLFPREDETQPRFRFPEFREAGEWSQELLGDIANVLMCKRIFANETNLTNGVPFYKIGTLGGIPDAFISKEIFSDYKQRYNYPRLGEVLITCSGTIGKCLPFDGRDSYFQDSNIVWIDNPTLTVTNRLLLSILSNVDWSGLNSTTITRIYGPDLRGLAITFPRDHLEQQRIADCLTSLDDLITAATQQLETLKTHKKALMQQLFPSAEAIEK